MGKTRKIKILSATTNMCLFASFVFVIIAVVWFVLYTPEGDMAKGFKRLAYTVILFFIACGFMVLSSVFRYLLLRNAVEYRTRKQHVILILTAAVSIIIVLSFIGNLGLVFYESYIM